MSGEATATPNAGTQPGTTPVTPGATPAVKPEGVPDKFWDATTGQVNYAEWSKSYGELESNFTKARQGLDTKLQDPNATTQDKLTAIQEANEQGVNTGLDMNALGREYMENNRALKPESYEKLEKLGFKREDVDQYIAGQEALAEKFEAQINLAAGGEDNLKTMIEWAASNLTPAEIDAFNAAVDGDLEKARLAVTGLRQRYETANGREGNPLTGNASTTGGAVPFASSHEVTQAMRDPRYATDEAYRKQVENRLAVSFNQGVSTR